LATDRYEWCIVVFTNDDGTQELLVRRLYHVLEGMATRRARIAVRWLTEAEAVDYAARYEKLLKEPTNVRS